MIDRQQLLAFYTSRPSINAIAKQLADTDSKHVRLNGLIGSSQALILGAVASLSNQSQITF